MTAPPDATVLGSLPALTVGGSAISVCRPLRTHLVQLAILSNHQNGRDTHLRLADIFSPLE